MRTKLKKAVAVLSAVCALNALATGCSLHPASAAETAANGAAPEALNDAPQTDGAEKAGNAAGTENAEKPQENSGGKWHVLDPEIAAAVDADFIGKVWHIAEGAFSVAEEGVQILDDGSRIGSSPSSNANIPDSQLIHVVVDDDTYFYTRTFSSNGDSYEDAEAGFGDLQEYMSVEMKGSFENDVFYAAEIRMIKIS